MNDLWTEKQPAITRSHLNGIPSRCCRLSSQVASHTISSSRRTRASRKYPAGLKRAPKTSCIYRELHFVQPRKPRTPSSSAASGIHEETACTRTLWFSRSASCSSNVVSLMQCACHRATRTALYSATYVEWNTSTSIQVELSARTMFDLSSREVFAALASTGSSSLL